MPPGHPYADGHASTDRRSADQKAKGATGATYGDDTEAEIYANQNAQTFLNDINPGNSVTGVLVFDIPKDAKITQVELHDSILSGGVVITVG